MTEGHGREKLHPETLVTHQPVVLPPSDNPPLAQPIYQSVKFDLPSYGEVEKLMRGERSAFFYSRVSNPTVRQLEQLGAELQGRSRAIAVTSGVAAITTALAGLLSTGDHAILFYESYKPSRTLFHSTLKRFGVSCTLLSLTDAAGLERAIIPNKTRVILFESPTNPMLQIADIKHITELARRHHITTVMDNTFASFHNHGQFPIDIFVHSLTKYASGHGDVMGGLIIGDGPAMDAIAATNHDIGANIDPHAAWLISRGMKTFFLRYERQCATARRVAEYLTTHPAVSRVIYPGLSSHPRHALARAQMKDFGTMIALDLKNPSDMPRFFDQLKLFKLVGSLGSTESLIAPASLFYATDLSDDEKRLAGITPTSIRLSIGIEHEQDLIADLAAGGMG
jgi:cystathionine beta-lyase/cystathionine gamma-synthase